MKQKIYTITLLLSFLVILGHEMIPHHHHEIDLDEFSSFHNHDVQYTHQKTEVHHHHDVDNHKHNHSNDSGKEKENKHPFPLHHHLSADEDFDYIRVQLKKDSNVSHTLVAVLCAIGALKIAHPPEIDLIRFREKPFFNTAIFEPGATGLRAPPSIA